MLGVHHIVQRLGPIANVSIVDDATFRKLVKHSCNALLGAIADEDVLGEFMFSTNLPRKYFPGDESIKLSPETTKSLFAALCTIFSEFAKTNATSMEIKCIISPFSNDQSLT